MASIDNINEVLSLCNKGEPVRNSKILIEKSFLAILSSPTTPTIFTKENLNHFILLVTLLRPSVLSNAPNIEEILNIYHTNLTKEWNDSYLNAVITLCFGVAMKGLRVSKKKLPESLEHVNEDDVVMESLNNRAIHYIKFVIMESQEFYSSINGPQAIDKLFKDFITYFPKIVNYIFELCENELFSLEKETAIDFEQPELNFATLLSAMSNLFENNWEGRDKCIEEYFSNRKSKIFQFVISGQSITSPHLFIVYLDFLKFLTITEDIAKIIYEMFMNPMVEETFCDWNVYFNSIIFYKNLYVKNKTMVALNPSFQGRQGYQVIGQTLPSVGIKPHELEGLTAWSRFSETIALKCSDFRKIVLEYEQWRAVDNMCGLLMEDIPIQLKGCLYRFLASLVSDENSVTLIWNYLLKGKSLTSDSNTLFFEEDLDKKEIPIMVYDASLGIYLSFVTKRIIGEAGERSYEKIEQMWGLLTTSINCLYELLRDYFVDSNEVVNQSVEVALLMQLLNESSLSRSLSKIIVNSAEAFSSGNPKCVYRVELSLASIRLLQTAFALHSSLKTLLRQVESSAIISSLDSILLSNLYCLPNVSYLSVLLTFVNNNDQYVRHTFYVMKILRDLISVRPSPQQRLVHVLMSQKNFLQEQFYGLSEIDNKDFELGFNQLPLEDLTNVSTARIRGEIIRLIIEIFVDSVNSSCKGTNITFLLLNFDMSSMIALSSLKEMASADLMASTVSPLRGFVDIINTLIEDENPFLASTAPLYEPILRLFLALSSMETNISTTFLRYLRGHHDLIYRLTACAGFRGSNEQFEPSMLCIHNLIRSNILNLIAVEIRALFKQGNISVPEKYYEALFCGNSSDDDDDFSGNSNFLISLFVNMPLFEYQDFEEPNVPDFLQGKIDKIFSQSIREASLGVKQIDLDYLKHQLEVAYSLNNYEKKTNSSVSLFEYQAFLEYATIKNQALMIEYSCNTLKESVLSIVNIITEYTPNSFMSNEAQEGLISDWIFCFIRHVICNTENESSCNIFALTIMKLCNSLCKVSTIALTEEDGSNSKIVDIVEDLFKCISQNEFQKYVVFKKYIYSTIVLLLTIIKKKTYENAEKNTNDSIVEFFESKKTTDTILGQLISERVYELVSSIVKDINEASDILELPALSALNCLIAASYQSADSVVQEFISTGCLRSVLDSLTSKEEDERDWSLKVNSALFAARISLLIRIGSLECGWSVLSCFNIFEKLASMKIWSNVPEAFYIDTKLALKPGNYVYEYLQLLNICLRFIFVMLSNPKWRQISLNVMNFIVSLRPIFDQLIYSQVPHPILYVMRSITSFIFVADKSVDVPEDLVNFLDVDINDEEFPPLSLEDSKKSSTFY
ncbi:Nuclear pore complex protein Nup205 [Strongyloides ratti]|uniref:Nuclear pore complex protein Nup205 n=1 Tax=Strongyloides ratti TaxID=34506 RepID=A0A090MYV2_STRRB|nr:Nuclear pore complex protein Nup205 [Strongyloides ratti]CEF67829.1 Nuclear pore complex protein Nup205 [Strongyloides ratti]